MRYLDFWDYITFGVLIVLGASGIVFMIFIAGLPGRIAIARKHPDAEAVNLMGWAGILTVVVWLQAFMWAFKPTNVIDVRRTPTEEKKAIAEEIATLTDKAPDRPSHEHRPPDPEKATGGSAT